MVYATVMNAAQAEEKGAEAKASGSFPARQEQYAEVLELADRHGLGPCALKVRVGSTPTFGTHGNFVFRYIFRLAITQAWL